MKIGIIQPGYLPWLGFFEQMYQSDIFVLYDDVQYDKQSWRNRNRIKTSNGEQWLSVPVNFSLKAPQLLKDVKIESRHKWVKKHLSSIRQNYSKAPYYKIYIGLFEEAYKIEWEYLVELDIYFITKLAECLGIKNREIIRSSELDIRDDDRIKRLIKICKQFNADTFYEGASGRNYINPDDFEQHGIKVEFQDYKHSVYNQLYGDFIPYLSVVDLVFNHGEESLSILINGNSSQRE